MVGDPASAPQAGLLSPRPGGVAQRFAARFDGRHPAVVFLAALALGFVVVAALSIGVGLLVTDVLIKSGGIASADEGFVESLVADRTAFLTDASAVGSTVGSTVLVVLAVAVGIVFAFRRQWRLAAFAALLPAVESGLYRVTSIADPRHRPDVPRLEDLDVNASYPSGHTAASIAVYAGLVLLLTSTITERSVRWLAWTVATLIPIFVALSRMYRGMHHPLDAAGGVLVGLGAIAILVFACRAAGAAEEFRSMY
jgi:membrane-associated phospholipid phosphatase